MGVWPAAVWVGRDWGTVGWGMEWGKGVWLRGKGVGLRGRVGIGLTGRVGGGQGFGYGGMRQGGRPAEVGLGQEEGYGTDGFGYGMGCMG